jgi:hypothetical protein
MSLSPEVANNSPLQPANIRIISCPELSQNSEYQVKAIFPKSPEGPMDQLTLKKAAELLGKSLNERMKRGEFKVLTG